MAAQVVIANLHRQASASSLDVDENEPPRLCVGRAEAGVGWMSMDELEKLDGSEDGRPTVWAQQTAKDFVATYGNVDGTKVLVDGNGNIMHTRDILKDLTKRATLLHTREKGYLRLGLFFLFYALYVVVLMMERSPTVVNETQEAVKHTLFTPATSTINTDDGRVTKYFSDVPHIYSWLSSLMKDVYVVDPPLSQPRLHKHFRNRSAVTHTHATNQPPTHPPSQPTTQPPPTSHAATLTPSAATAAARRQRSSLRASDRYWPTILLVGPKRYPKPFTSKILIPSTPTNELL